MKNLDHWNVLLVGHFAIPGFLIILCVISEWNSSDSKFKRLWQKCKSMFEKKTALESAFHFEETKLELIKYRNEIKSKGMSVNSEEINTILELLDTIKRQSEECRLKERIQKLEELEKKEQKSNSNQIPLSKPALNGITHTNHTSLPHQNPPKPEQPISEKSSKKQAPPKKTTKKPPLPKSKESTNNPFPPKSTKAQTNPSLGGPQLGSSSLTALSDRKMGKKQKKWRKRKTDSSEIDELLEKQINLNQTQKYLYIRTYLRVSAVSLFNISIFSIIIHVSLSLYLSLYLCVCVLLCL